MSRVSIFNSPLLLGFDEFERTLDRISKKAADGYPPYNIEQLGDDRLCITLAVAGFGEDDLTVEIVDNQLLIQGRQREDDAGRVYLHRGIAARQFQRTFILADGIVVEGARLDKGLLRIDIIRPKPESRVRTVKITSAKSGKIKESATKLDLDSR
jgi:HSP20 family molecular chaperone IbpA